MRKPRSSGNPLLLVIFILGFSAIVAYALSSFEEQNVIAATFALVIVILSFLSTEISLFILIISMLLSPEIILSTTSRGALSRGITLRTEDILLLIIGFVWISKTAIYKNLGLFLKTPLNKPIFFYISACVISTLLGIITDRVKPAPGLLYVTKYFQYFFIYFMVVNHLRTRDQCNRYLFGFYATCVVACIIGIANIPITKRVSAPFEGDVGEPNTFGGYLVLLLDVAIGLYFFTVKKRLKLILLPVFGIGFSALLLTLSRASYISFIASFFILIAVIKHRRNTLLFLLFSAILLSPFVVPDSVKNRVFHTFKQDRFSVKVGAVSLDGSTSARINSYIEVLHDWGKHPLLGYGVTGYKFIDAQYFKILIDTGAIGFIAFLLLVISIFRHVQSIKHRLDDRELIGIICGFQAGFFGLIVHGFGANTFIIVRIMEPFWFIIAMISMFPIISTVPTTKEITTAPKVSVERGSNHEF